MFNPTYLQRSRHGVFYFRWTIPPCKRAARPSGSIRLSLRTREPRQALQLAMPLSYLARSITERGVERGMDFKQLRTVLTDHFSRFLAARKAQIDEAGPLSDADRMLMKNTAAVAEMELADGEISRDEADRTARDFIKRYELDVRADSPLFETFKRAIAQAQRDYAKAVLAYSADAESFDFNPPAQQRAPAETTEFGSLTLAELVEKFWRDAKQENRWASKTEGEKQEHIDLLYERLGRDIQLSAFGRTEAHLMKDTLRAYPVNRHKLKETRGKPLLEVLELTTVRKLHTLTVNKYLQTYQSLFGWALRNGYCAVNPFDGLALSTKTVNAVDPRIGFSDEQVEAIRNAVIGKNKPHEEHHKWGTLLAIHTGARLNEIAQLHLEDIRQIDGIWCFDINQKPGTRKKLKNAASRRIVPVHPRLIEYGFLDYFESMKARKGNDRLFPQFSYSKSDGYGRNLGRWVNESLLPDLSIKSSQLTFHSFRHAIIGRLNAANVSQEHVMAIVGHEQGTTTLKVYNRNGFPPKLLLVALEKTFQPQPDPELTAEIQEPK